MSDELLSPGRALTLHAQERPDEVALRLVRADRSEATLTWSQLEAAANRLARRLAELGVHDDATVAVGLPNSLEHTVAAQAIWKLGACVLPLSAKLPAAERDELLALGKPAVVIADWPDVEGLRGADVLGSEGDASPLPDVIPQPWKAVASGGSTGKPKLIVTPGAFAAPGGAHPLAALTGLRDRDVVAAARAPVPQPGVPLDRDRAHDRARR